MEKTARITKAMRYTDIVALLKGEKPTNGTDLEAAVSFIEKEMEALARKNASKSAKPTAVQTENEKLKADILEFMSTPIVGDDGEEAARVLTCTEISKGVASLTGFNNQKIAALLNQLVKAGQLTKDTIKGKTLFWVELEGD